MKIPLTITNVTIVRTHYQDDTLYLRADLNRTLTSAEVAAFFEWQERNGMSDAAFKLTELERQWSIEARTSATGTGETVGELEKVLRGVVSRAQELEAEFERHYDVASAELAKVSFPIVVES